MKVIPIKNSLTDEHILDIQPSLSVGMSVDWRRRLRFFTGRTLSDLALTAEQDGRNGRIALRGQMVSPGVVNGLEVDLDTTGAFYRLTAGVGITASGEDVVIPKPLRVAVNSLPVYAPPALLDGNTPTPPETGSLLPRKLGPSLGELIAAGRSLPQAGILVLQPVLIEVVGEFNPDDQCEIDLQNDAYADWQLVDGCRLVYYPWPTDWQPLPPRDDRWRNRLAYTIFAAERQLGAADLLPWEMLGVPLGLVGFATDWQPEFVDGYAVVRAGGKPKRRSSLIPQSGNPFLWQAQVQQFGEQIAEATAAEMPTIDLANQFRYLPPFGLLPKDAIAPRDNQNHFFPNSYHIEAVPVPLEQLDVAMESSASLAAFDTFTPDRVRVLVPVPQMWYEPELLQTAVVDPEFAETIQEFSDRRAEWLLRRQQIREVATLLFHALKGKDPVFPDPDPGALEDNERVATPSELDADNPENNYGGELEADYGTETGNNGRFITELEDLRQYLQTSTPLQSSARVEVAALNGNAPTIPAALASKITFTPATDNEPQARLRVTGILTAAERDQLLPLVASDAWRTAVTRLFTLSQNDDLARLDSLGLERFIDFLEDKVQKANDKVDLGFLRVQTDIYRHRQLMLGNINASRLATSPILATIAQGDSAAVTREQLSDFLANLKKNDAAALEDAAPAAGGSAPVGPVAFTAVQPTFSSATGIAGDTFLSSALSFTAPTFTPTTAVASALPGILASAPQTPSTASRLATLGSASLFGTASSGIDPSKIIEGAAIIGSTHQFRNATVAERLETPKGQEAKDASVASKFEVVRNAIDVEINTDDLVIPGFLDAQGNETSRRLFEIRERGLGRQILDGIHDPNATDDESGFFSAGVKALENSVSVMRVLEGRIHQYRQAIVRCREALRTISEYTQAADSRLKLIDDEVAEARHDVAVARALLAEEIARISRINQRRDQIIAEQVAFLAYQRPRTSDLLLENVPVRTLEAGITESPLPACFAQTLTPPPELEAMVALFRDVPLKWLTQVPQYLVQLDRLEKIQTTLANAKSRAQLKFVTQSPPPLRQQSGRLGSAVMSVFAAQQQVITQHRIQTAQLNLAQVAAKSWKQAREQAQQSVSLGDLIDTDHGRSDLAQKATRELDDIAQVATCLYDLFGDVVPRVRLSWAEGLSVYDRPVNLRSLASLPEWGSIDDRQLREQMQTLVDWLYQRVDLQQPEAVALMNDLVRICILLASHAPVSRIISGRVKEETTAVAGGQVKLAVDPTKVRIGMPVMLYEQERVIAHAIVEDLTTNQASARILQVTPPSTGSPSAVKTTQSIQVTTETRVQFGEQRAFVGETFNAYAKVIRK